VWPTTPTCYTNTDNPVPEQNYNPHKGIRNIIRETEKPKAQLRAHTYRNNNQQNTTQTTGYKNTGITRANQGQVKDISNYGNK